MLAGVSVPAAATADLASIVRAFGADELADRLERALADEVKILALTIDEREIILDALDDPPEGLSELRGVLMNEHHVEAGQRVELAARVRRGALAA